VKKPNTRGGPRRPHRQGHRRASPERLVGVHCVAEAMRAGRRRLFRLLVRPGADSRPEIREVLATARKLGLPVIEVEREDLAADEGGNPQGVILEAGPLPEVDLDTLCAPSEGARRIVALDGVEDPQNVGALARVAEGSGARGMVLTARRAPPLTPALARASAGAIEWLPVARVTNLARAIRDLKSKGFWVVGADLGASESIYEVPDRILTGDLVVVLGAEGRGLRPEIQKLIDHPVRIPMHGEVASLNVSAAGAVLLFELMRRTERGDPPS
jgi:23S rRNA (guanosine2251-2'-O)-methyltransferase